MYILSKKQNKNNSSFCINLPAIVFKPALTTFIRLYTKKIFYFCHINKCKYVSNHYGFVAETYVLEDHINVIKGRQLSTLSNIPN
jgi:hypothetical protein